MVIEAKQFNRQTFSKKQSRILQYENPGWLIFLFEFRNYSAKLNFVYFQRRGAENFSSKNL